MNKKLTTICAALALAGMSSVATASEQTVYQFATVQSTPTTELQALEKDSVQYWQQVSGKELKRGVPVFVNQQEHFIRIAPRARFENGEVFKPYDLQLDKFTVRDAKLQQQLPMQVMANHEQMRDAGFSDGSVGLKLGHIKGNGKPMLQTSQALNDDDTYLINVIEKGSGNALHAKTQFKMKEHQQRLGVELSMGQKRFKNKDVQLTLHSPDGEQIEAYYQDGEAIFNQPLSYVGAVNGYYELEATVSTTINGQEVKRSVKMPFVQNTQTISMKQAKVKALGDNSYQATVPVDVEEQGRYAIRATLTGKGSNGERIKLATVEVAKAMNGSDQFIMPFSVSQAAKAPFELVDIELTDQTRMLKFAQQQ